MFDISSVISQMPSDIDLCDTNVAKDIIAKTWELFFHPKALRTAHKGKDTRGYNLRLCLRDMATVVEADQAARAGDIGRLMQMWKRWSIMAQGMKGLSLYGQHLPRLILLLQHYLPPGLAFLIKHSILVASGGRANHWMAKDLYLECQIWWLKNFFNHAVSQIDLVIVEQGFSKGN